LETEQFDALTRRLGGAGPSRRQALWALGSVLLSGALGSVAASLGLVTDAEATANGKNRKAKPKPRRAAHTVEKERGRLQAEGKGKKKRKKRKPPPLPPGCRDCGDCEMCLNGACAPDPELDLVRCLESPEDRSGQCHVCQNGACVPLPNDSLCNDGDECSWCQDGRCVPVRDKQLDPCGNDPCKRCLAGRCTGVGDGDTCKVGSIEGACCSGVCKDLDLDRNNCGQCGRRCEPGDVCRQGACEPPCPAPCDNECCEPGQTCVYEWTGTRFIRRCCDNDRLVGGQCCDGDKTICGPPGNQRCCPAGSKCYQDAGGLWMCCHGELCGQHRCCTGSTSCHSGCGTPDGKACCIGETGCACCRTCPN
jgi:hypothetical protein